MSTVRVSRTEFDKKTASVRITVGRVIHDVAIAARQNFSRPTNFGDVWLPLALFPSMRTGLDLYLEDPVSNRLLLNADRIQRIMTTWYPDLTRVKIHASSGTRSRGPKRRSRQGKSAQFFTGGVDSFFTLQSNPEVQTLLYMHDDLHDTQGVRDRISTLLRSVALAEGKRLLEFDSAIRPMLDQYAEWGTQTHGAALASVAALASASFKTVLIPATHTFNELYPWGSHAALDHLWSSEELTVVHDAADSSRFEKIAALVESEVAMQHLRVCWATQDEVNCSTCEKCIRTMTSLDILGQLERCSTFQGPLDLDSVRGVVLSSVSDVSFSHDNSKAATGAGRVDLAAAIEHSITRFVGG
jgi:hypothetical protein